ncbi:MAG: carboxypeptidase regulatory-like domain-containing protein [Rikenellaceae bacterium]
MKHILLLALLAATTLFGCSEVETSIFGTLQGSIVESSTSTPITGAEVTLSPGGNSYITGSDGRYEFTNLISQQYTVLVSKSGFQSSSKSITVTPGQTVTGSFSLAAGVSSIYTNLSSLSFGTSLSQLSFNLTNMGSVSTYFEISDNLGDWCTISPKSGTLQASNGTTGITVTINRDKITESKLDNIIISSDNGGSTSVIISVSYDSGSTSGGDEDSSGGTTSGSATSAVTNGLWAYYTFDNEDMQDAWENGMNGIIENTPTFVTNTPNGSGKALKLGLNSSNLLVKAKVPYNPFATITEYSYCFWLRDPTQGLIMNGYGKDSDNRYTNYPVIRLYDTKLYACFKSYSITSDYFNYAVSSTLQDGNWHHVAVSVKSGEQILYIDGVKYSTQQTSVSLSESSEIHFGGELSSYSGSDMKIDNIRIYSRVISADDAKSIYNAEK